MILHSSENITRLQSISTVQYLFPRAQARRPLTFASRILIFFRATRLWKLFLYKQRLTVTLETTVFGHIKVPKMATVFCPKEYSSHLIKFTRGRSKIINKFRCRSLKSDTDFDLKISISLVFPIFC